MGNVLCAGASCAWGAGAGWCWRLLVLDSSPFKGILCHGFSFITTFACTSLLAVLRTCLDGFVCPGKPSPGRDCLGQAVGSASRRNIVRACQTWL